MKMNSRHGMAAAAILLGACASGTPESDAYWRSTAAQRSDFATDNAGCSARASRVVPQPRADQMAGGATIPDNRIDRPPRHWVSAVAEGAYMDCMAERGWHLAQR
jgi:hypothetical protein